MNNRINSTRFLNQEELASQLLELDINENNYPMGGIPLLTMGDKLYVDATDSHTIIFGATGSKKTRMFAMPSVGIFARAGESFVVTDPKGELYQRTSGEVARQGYEVHCLNLRNMEAGETWNPFFLPYRLYHNGERAKAMEMVQEMATMMTDDPNGEKFWTYATIDVLCGFIFYLFETEPVENCTLNSLNTMWESYIERRRTFLNKIDDKYGNTMIPRKLSPLKNDSEKTVGSIEAVVSMALNRIMINEAMIKYLSENSISLEEIAKKKSAVYLVIPDENTTYHFVAGLFLEQLYEVLINEAHKREDNQLERRMNFLIDEFANIPKINNMDSMITASRSRNIRFHLIIQSMKQLRHKYEEYADVICSNCNNWIYLYSKEYELLQEISRLCGEVIYDNGLRVPLFSEFDLQHLDKGKGEALVLSGRNFPCISNLKDIDEYPFVNGCFVPPLRKKESKEQAEKIKTVPEEKKEEKKEENQAKVSLVTLGPADTFLSVDICKEDEIKKHVECCQRVKLSNVYALTDDNISWYTADEKMGAEYRKLRGMKKRFLTLSDFPEYQFKPYIEAKNPLTADTSFDCMLWTSYKGTRSDICIDSIPDYGGEFGLLYAKKKLFYLADEALGTLYSHTNKRWELVKRDNGEWLHKKVLDNGYSIYLKLCRNRNNKKEENA